MVNSIINLAFGDNICHPYISILGMDYFWIYHTIVFFFPLSFSFGVILAIFQSASDVRMKEGSSASPQRIVVISFWMWRFPKSWGYPQIIRFCCRIFHYQPSSFWGTPPLFGTPHVFECFWKFWYIYQLVGGLEHFFFPYIGNNHPNWVSWFSEG